MKLALLWVGLAEDGLVYIDKDSSRKIIEIKSNYHNKPDRCDAYLDICIQHAFLSQPEHIASVASRE